MIWIKEYSTQGEILLAACDEDILGKTFSEGELELVVSEKFYGGEKVKGEDLISHLKKATIANLVGKKVIEIALELSLISEDCIIKIDGVPHAQIARLI
jgi:hypothetical protein